MARRRLLSSLDAVRLTARAMAQKTPGLEDKFQLPDPQTDQGLLTAGRLFVRDAQAFKSEFLALAMPETFLDDLTAVIDHFEQAIRTRENGRGDAAAARTSIKTSLAAGAAAALALDAMVINHLGDVPSILEAWKRVRRVVHPSKRRTEPQANANALETPMQAQSASEATS